jgi:hypothetical protein
MTIIQIPFSAEKHWELALVWVRIFQKEWNKLEIRIRIIPLVAKIYHSKIKGKIK